MTHGMYVGLSTCTLAKEHQRTTGIEKRSPRYRRSIRLMSALPCCARRSLSGRLPGSGRLHSIRQNSYLGTHPGYYGSNNHCIHCIMVATKELTKVLKSIRTDSSMFRDCIQDNVVMYTLILDEEMVDHRSHPTEKHPPLDLLGVEGSCEQFSMLQMVFELVSC